jgi:hypothetical protein
MRKLFLFLVLLTLAAALRAQDDCSDAAILAKKGTWEKRPDANLQSDRNQAQILRFLDTVGKLFLGALPQPKGIKAAWYRTMGDPLLPGWPVAYNFNSLYFCWFCSKEIHKLALSDETGTWVWVHVNNWGWFFGDRPKEKDLKVDGAFIYNMPAKVGTWKGFDLYQSTIDPSNRCIVLGRRGALPFRPVTQEEYLNSVRAFLQEEKKPTGPSPEQQAADDEKEIDRIQNSPNIKPELKQAMLKGIRERQQMQARSNSAAIISRAFDDQITVIDNYLRNTPASQLRQPAILPRQGRSLFDGNFTTEQNGGLMKVTVNRDYLDRRLPGYRPQFMVLYWSWEKKNAASMNFKEQFESDFPVERLQSILDR